MQVLDLRDPKGRGESGLKDEVRRFWDARPCGTSDIAGVAEASRAFFEALDIRRYALEPFIGQYACFAEQAGRRVLEIGCGAGSDLARFARGGGVVTGVDLSPRTVALARRRLALEGLTAELAVADAEALPFRDEWFDFVYSWGVLHHTPDTAQAVAEVYRVLVPGGRACVMLYHLRSLFALQAWVRYALLQGRPWHSASDVLAAHIESPGTKAYTVAEARALFDGAGFTEIVVETVLTPWDVRFGRRRFLPAWCRRFLPNRWGWFLVVCARRSRQ